MVSNKPNSLTDAAGATSTPDEDHHAAGRAEKRLRLSCGDWSFGMAPHAMAIDLISNLGFDAVDIMLRGGSSHVRPEDIVDDVAGWARRLRERVRGRGLEIADVFWIPRTDFAAMAANHPDSAERRRGVAEFRHMLELAAGLGVPGVTVLPGINWPQESNEESLERAAEEFCLRVAMAESMNLSLSVEPHVGSICETPADAARLCELAPGLELTLDYTHFVAQGFSAADIEPLLKVTRHLHARGGG
jgi:sugar phosphate isomerase/epimerase